MAPAILVRSQEAEGCGTDVETPGPFPGAGVIDLDGALSEDQFAGHADRPGISEIDVAKIDRANAVDRAFVDEVHAQFIALIEIQETVAIGEQRALIEKFGAAQARIVAAAGGTNCRSG